jgi:N6-adenosine-specific RNA methylase IME4
MNFPKGKYAIVYADPPWKYRDKVFNGKRGVHWKYPTMTMGEIKALPVDDIAASNSWLFLWIPWPLVREEARHQIIEEWGFDYKSVGFLWVKTNKKSNTPFWGMGNYTRSNSEPCLIAKKGNPKRKSAKVHQIIFQARQGLKHSEKPAVTRNRIVKLCGNRKRIELFARTKVKGWSNWGLEAPK